MTLVQKGFAALALTVAVAAGGLGVSAASAASAQTQTHTSANHQSTASDPQMHAGENHAGPEAHNTRSH
jgi:hypothetical protein